MALGLILEVENVMDKDWISGLGSSSSLWSGNDNEIGGAKNGVSPDGDNNAGVGGWGIHVN